MSLQKERIIGLDVLRAIAILAVVFSHTLYFLTPLITLGFWGLFVTKAIDWVEPLGLLGVELFFVLSGFLIGSILIRIYTNTPFSIQQVGHFLQRRWFRTLPSYWLILTINILLYYVLGYSSIDANKLLYYPFCQNVITPHPPYFFGEAWSLSVEEWSYFLLAISLFIASRVIPEQDKEGFLFRFFLFFILVFVFIRAMNAFQPINGAEQDAGIRKVVVFRLDALVYGIFMGYLNLFKAEWLKKWRFKLFIFGLAGAFFTYYLVYKNGIDITRTNNYPAKFFADAFLYLWLPFGFSLILPYANSVHRLPFNRLNLIIEHISKISYAMYLIHYSLLFIPFFSFLQLQNPATVTILYILYWVILLVLSSLFYKYFELPFTNLRDRIK